MAVLEAALGGLGPDDLRRALVLAQLCQAITFGSPLDRRLALAEEAVSIAERSGDPAVTVSVLNHVANPLRVPRLLGLSLDRTARALELSATIDDPLLRIWALAERLSTVGCVADVDEMDRCLAEIALLAERLGQPTLTWLSTLRRGTRAMISGDTDTAERLATEALQIALDSGEPDAMAAFSAQYFSVSWQRGTMGDLVPMIDETVAANPGVPQFTAAKVGALADADRLDEARDMLRHFADSGYDMPLDLLWMSGMGPYAEAAIECDEPEIAGPLLERLEPLEDQFFYSDTVVIGPVSIMVGGLATVLGRFEQAEACFRRSAEVCERIGATFFTARTELLWGRMAARRRGPGDGEAARRRLARARTRHRPWLPDRGTAGRGRARRPRMTWT